MALAFGHLLHSDSENGVRKKNFLGKQGQNKFHCPGMEREIAFHRCPSDPKRRRRKSSTPDRSLVGTRLASKRARTSQDPRLLRRLLRAKDRMDAASHEAWPVPRLARVSGVSAAHFARSFKEAFGVPPHRYLLTRRLEKAFGVPPHRYLLTRRLEKAAALLRDTELSITEIAFETGWTSLGTFGRTFHDVTGASPSELRAREKAALHQPERVPGCFLSAAHRPGLTMAVSEKRRQLRRR